MSAALWCDELGLDAIVLESSDELGGQLLWTYNRIENYLGVRAKNGKEVRDIFANQINERRFTVKFEVAISEIDFDEKNVFLADGKRLDGKTLIIATGVSRRKLGIEGEERFKGKGILESGKRDKDKVKDQTVLIVGGGDAAIENALILAETAEKVLVAHRRDEFRARNEFLNDALANKKIQLLRKTSVLEIDGDEKVEIVKLKNSVNHSLFSLNVDAILFRIGVVPNTRLFKDEIALDENGYIQTTNLCETNVKGIFAIGDAANPVSPTISTAAGTGATAIKTIRSRIK